MILVIPAEVVNYWQGAVLEGAAVTTTQLVIGLVSMFLAVMVPFVGGAYYFGRKLGRIESRLDVLTNNGSAIGETVGALVGYTQLSDRDRSDLMRALARGLNPPGAPSNPFSSEERARYNRYVQMAQDGEEFTPAQVREFNRLIALYKKEHPSDPNIPGLLLLGAFLIGLYLLSKRGKRDD